MKDFERRKKEHIKLALNLENQSLLGQRFSLRLLHEALPEMNFSEVSLRQKAFHGLSFKSPFFVSSMTAGHKKSTLINTRLARACEKRGWIMGVGSQRKQLKNEDSAKEWEEVRKKAPNVFLMGNLGLSQVISEPIERIKKILQPLQAQALIVHTNPLQEVLQDKGTPFFKGGLKSLEKLCHHLKIPVILKEVGCGFSQHTLIRLKGIGLYAVDISGFGGTHWGRIEQKRHKNQSFYFQLGETFKDWGISTQESLLKASQLSLDYHIWASGGLRNGREAAICVALGAQMLGLAQPLLKEALKSSKALEEKMKLLEEELKVCLFCTGSKDLPTLREKGSSVLY